MKIAIVLGTRPEIIKMSPIIRECERLGLNYFILHTGQHYSYNMDKVFFEQLELPEAKYNLDVGSGSHAEQTGKMLIGIEKVLRQEWPDIVLVEGDTNTVLAGALAAVKLGIKVGHVEAPTEKSRQILIGEGVAEEKIFVTGNTIVDAIFQNLEIARKTVNILNDLSLNENEYFLVTVHRQENVDDEKRFRNILKGLEMVHKEFGAELIYPIHPRSRKRLEAFGLNPNGVRLVEPLDYLHFLQLESNARLVLTDSGGVQEEACILGVPCVTLRDNTERPETIEVGANVLAGTSPQEIVEKVDLMLKGGRSWSNPFGDGKASERIIKILRDKTDCKSIKNAGKSVNKAH